MPDIPLNRPLPDELVNQLGLLAFANRWMGRLSEVVVPVVQLTDTMMEESGFADFFLSPAVAAENSKVQVFNPVGSGVTVKVDAIITSGSGSQFTIYASATALTNDQGALTAREMGRSASMARLRSAAGAGLTGSTGVLYNVQASGGNSRELRFPRPLVLAEGTGVVVSSDTVTTAFTGGFEIREHQGRHSS